MAYMASFPPTPWETMSSCTQTPHAKVFSSDSTFSASKSNREGNEPCRSLADFIAPKETGLADHIGAFAVTSGIGLKELCDRFRAEHDDYNAIMAEAIADRLAEAFAECLHKRVRDEWGYGCDEGLSNADLIQEKYRGIRPAAGYPACPDHTEKGPLWRLLDVEANTGMRITESFAMWPGSSVSGLYFAHPQSRYFSLGKIDRDQVADYARTQEHERRRGRAMARAKPELRPFGIAFRNTVAEFRVDCGVRDRRRHCRASKRVVRNPY